MLGRDAFCFGTLRQGQAVTVWWGIVCCFAVGQGGHGEVGHGPFRHGEVSRVKAVMVRLGPLSFGVSRYGGRGAAHGFWYA